MQTLRDIAPYLALAGVAAALALFVLLLWLWARVRKLRQAQTVIMGHHEERDLVGLAVTLDSQVRNLREAVEILTDELDEHKRHLDAALTNCAIVRYNAFRDTGGEQSASFALLDDYRSGVVFSTISARDFARIYVKHLTHGVADRELSPEEEQVVAAAVPRPLKAGEHSPRALRLAPDERARASAALAAGPAAGGESPGRTAPPETPAALAAPSRSGRDTAEMPAVAAAAHDSDLPAPPPPARSGAAADAPLDAQRPPTLLDDPEEFAWEAPRTQSPPGGDASDA